MDYTKFNTKHLLTEYRRLKQEYKDLYYYGGEEEQENLAIMKEELSLIKKELNGREHILDKKESKEKRQRLAKKYKHGRGSHKK